MGLQAYNHAAEVKVRAERKAGEILAQLERGGGGDRKSENIKNSNMEDLISEYREVLAQLGGGKPGPKELNSMLEYNSEYKGILTENEIPNTTAFRWQQLVGMKEEEEFDNRGRGGCPAPLPEKAPERSGAFLVGSYRVAEKKERGHDFS